MRRLGLVLLVGLIPSVAVFAQAPHGEEAAFVRVGAGSYALGSKGAGTELPPRDVFITDDWKRPLPTNEWFTSLVSTRFSDPLHVHPLSVRAVKSGLEVGTPDRAVKRFDDGDVEISRPHLADFVVEPREFAPRDARLARAGDWTVTFSLARRESAVNVTLAKGSPFVWLEPKGTALTLNFLEQDPEVLTVSPGKDAMLLRVRGHAYGLFAPPGSTFPAIAGRRLNVPAVKDDAPFVIAGLPDSSLETFEAFARVAPVRPVDSRVKWAYDPARSEVHTTFELDGKPLWGRETATLLGLYPHQWRNLDPEFVPGPYRYATIRGSLRLLRGRRFRTTMKFRGVLPWLPEVEGSDRERLAALVTEFRTQGEAFPVPFVRRGLDGKSDGYASYWVGKNLQRIAQVIPIARQVGDEKTASKLLEVLKSQLEWWFRAEKHRQDGQPVDDNMFFYDRLWGALIGVGASHGSDVELNDHHFQHGYWIHAAALVALLDPDWARSERWGGMVELLIRDIASPSRNDPLFPFLRCFSPYEGHSWASGCGTSEHGPNQESSSEAINAWTGIILWGQATGNAELTALGVYLHATETEAIHNYWFDGHGDVLDPEYPEPYASIVWASKYAHQTWWTEDPNSIHAINVLPVTGGSFHLARDPQVVLRLHDKARSEWEPYIRSRSTREPGGNAHPDHWQDLMLSMLALADPARALDAWLRSQVPEDVASEFGESRAHTFHWLAGLSSLGAPRSGLGADMPLFQAFQREGRITYVAYNPDATDRTVRFGDGTRLRVPARTLLRQGAAAPPAR